MANYHLSGIYVYPVKSLGGIRVNTIKVEEKGLEHDRRWMLIDENDTFMTIRKYAEFLFFQVEILPEAYRITFRDDTLTIPHTLQEGDKVFTEVWGSGVEAIVGHQDWNQWFSDRLGVQCRLVHMPENAQRKIKAQWGESTVSFADGYPFLIAGKASLDDLNARLDVPVEMGRFRPNLVFEGGEAYEEFRWSRFTIGRNHFQGLKPCERCVVTTYDLTTGEKGREPLLTLSKQKVNDKIVFGQHTLALDHLEISEGDEIIVEHYKDSPYDPL
ncbi:MAG: MOSC domain-containing protein [Cytophagales bacterium]|nr:MOSC domain-containing protein [Cytophagales bacterium]